MLTLLGTMPKSHKITSDWREEFKGAQVAPPEGWQYEMVRPMNEISESEIISKGKAVCEKLAANSPSLARAVIDAREFLGLHLCCVLVKKSLDNLIPLLAYACKVQSRGRRTNMDVEKMIDAWLPLVKALAIAHDIDERDVASSKLDELLRPILEAPIGQIRNFYRGLTARLKADQTVPWSIWRLFEFWGEEVLDNIGKEEVDGLKKEIAERIATLASQSVPPEDWVNAMVGALQWRSPEKLAEIEQGLKAGKKPRVRGKESCLFLEIGGAEVML